MWGALGHFSAHFEASNALKKHKNVFHWLYIDIHALEKICDVRKASHNSHFHQIMQKIRNYIFQRFPIKKLIHIYRVYIYTSEFRVIRRPFHCGAEICERWQKREGGIRKCYFSFTLSVDKMGKVSGKKKKGFVNITFSLVRIRNERWWVHEKTFFCCFSWKINFFP